MGNFCTNCGRELQEGEVCNCTTQATTSEPTPAVQPAPAPAPTPVAPNPAAVEVKQGFTNFTTVLKTIWTNPSQAVCAMSEKESWLPALILMAAQALLISISSLLCGIVFMEIDTLFYLFVLFLFPFFGSLCLSATMMGMLLALGKATKGTVTFKSALSAASVRCLVGVPFTFLAMFFGMASGMAALFLLGFGEIIAMFLTFMAVMKQFRLNINRTFLTVCGSYLTLFILLLFLVVIFEGANSYWGAYAISALFNI